MEDQEVASVNTGDPAAALAERRVLKIQTKLYQGVRHTHLGLTESPLR